MLGTYALNASGGQEGCDVTTPFEVVDMLPTTTTTATTTTTTTTATTTTTVAPTTTPTLAPTTTAASTTTTAAPTITTTTIDAGAGAGLPATGDRSGQLAMVALSVLTGGIALAAAARRRKCDNVPKATPICGFRVLEGSGSAPTPTTQLAARAEKSAEPGEDDE